MDAALSPPPPDIPMAYLPRLADAASLLNLSFGSALLFLLLALDAWRSKTKKSHWIPGDSLVLGALTLQLLGLSLSRPSVKISDSEKLNRESLLKMYDVIHSNLHIALSVRALTCVFIGNMVADVARSRDRNLWCDMLALSISVSAFLIHLSYEAYLFVITWITQTGELQPVAVVYLIIQIVVMASIVLLVLILGCAKSIDVVVAHRIPGLLSTSHPGSLVLWEAVEEHAVRSWIMARTHQPHYIISRSVLTSSIAFLVTICVVPCLGFSIFYLIISRHFVVLLGHGFEWLKVFVVAVQWIFILAGWATVCWRWLTAVVFYPRRMGSEALNLNQFFRVEDFWTRALLELQEEFMEREVESIESSSFLNNFLLLSIQKLRLYKLLPVLLHLQIFLVLMSKTCWLISEKLFSNNLMRRILMSGLSHEFSKLYNLHNGGLVGPRNEGDFFKHLNVLMCMPGENPAGLWMANLKSVEEVKKRMTEGESHGKNCRELISFLEGKNMQRSTNLLAFTQTKSQVENDFNMEKRSAKMTVVSLLTIIIELSAFYKEYVGSPPGPATDTVQRCIDACREAWGIIGLVDNSDEEAALVNKQAGRLFHSLRKWRKWLGVSLPINKLEARTVEAAKEALQGLAEKGKQMANGVNISSSSGCDSKYWKAVIAESYLCKLCESIKNRSHNIEVILDVIESLLADVIGSCMFKVEENIANQCSSWAEALMEEKLWNAFYEAWRAKGVTQQIQRPGFKFEMYGTSGYERIHSLPAFKGY